MSDLISRLSELRSQYNCFDENERDAYHTLSEAIKALKEQKTGKWIPCSERLPAINEEVFVYMYGVPYIAWLDSNGEWNTGTFTLREKDEAPTEWFSLPEPYKGE